MAFSIRFRSTSVAISKDSDSFYSDLSLGCPWKLVLVETGNVRPQIPASEILCRTPDGAPHVRGRTVVESQTFRRLLKVTPDDLDERFPVHDRVGIEGDEFVECNHAIC